MKMRVLVVLMVVAMLVAVVVAPVAAFAQGAAPVAAPAADGFGSTVWAFLNSAFGIGLLASAVLYVLNKIYAKRPVWEQFEGVVIDAVKMAEKAIPDDTENKSAAKLDCALKLVVATYEEYVKRKATAQEVMSFQNGISVVHDNLSAGGTL